MNEDVTIKEARSKKKEFCGFNGIDEPMASAFVVLYQLSY